MAECEDVLVVKHTFLDLNGPSIVERFRRERKAKTEVLQKVEPYMPGHVPEVKPAASERTTVMLRNLPNNYSREMFLHMLDQNGLKGLYDFAYLPCDFFHGANLGYAFVNMVDGSAVELIWTKFDGFNAWALPTEKVCKVAWSSPHQGLKAHVERYRNSPVMHKRVPDSFKPVIFQDGVRKDFPKPTMVVKAPF